MFNFYTMKKYRNCQSCGMPLRKDLKGSGTNAHGKPSYKYCSHCYENGEFKQPDITLKEMQEKVRGKIQEMGGIFKLFANYFAKKVTKLERWKTN